MNKTVVFVLLLILAILLRIIGHGTVLEWGVIPGVGGAVIAIRWAFTKV